MKNSRIIRLITLAAVAITAQLRVSGAPIVFTFQGSGDGFIGATTFSNAAFTITAAGDTMNRQSDTSYPFTTLPLYWIDSDSASINISGVGTFDFISSTRTYVNELYAAVGFSRGPGNGIDLFDSTTDSVFSAWDMQTSIGPRLENGTLLQWGSLFSSVDTTGGELFFQDGASPMTFQAVLVPEPGAVTIFLSLVTISTLIRRRSSTLLAR